MTIFDVCFLLFIGVVSYYLAKWTYDIAEELTCAFVPEIDPRYVREILAKGRPLKMVLSFIFYGSLLTWVYLIMEK